jgi:hypothetical protein
MSVYGGGPLICHSRHSQDVRVHGRSEYGHCRAVAAGTRTVTDKGDARPTTKKKTSSSVFVASWPRSRATSSFSCASGSEKFRLRAAVQPTQQPDKMGKTETASTRLCSATHT